MYVHGKISRRNAGEKRALATCDESLLFKRVYFKRHQDFLIFISFFNASRVSIYNGPRWDATFSHNHIYGH